MLLNDNQIEQRKIVLPFYLDSQRVVDGRKVVSYGASAYGYDIRTANEFFLLDNDDDGEFSVDPKNFDKDRNLFQMPVIHDVSGKYVIAPPRSSLVTYSLEVFDMPNDVLGIVFGKSTYARVGVQVNVTPLEPGWRGQLTMNINNLSSNPVKIYCGEGIAQVVFMTGYEPSQGYEKRGGLYQDSHGVYIRSDSLSASKV